MVYIYIYIDKNKKLIKKNKIIKIFDFEVIRWRYKKINIEFL